MTEETTQEQVDRLKYLLEQLNLSKYSSLSDILTQVFESSDKFNEFVDSLNQHISSEEVISKKLSNLYDYINELPKESDIKNIIPIDKLQHIANIVENHVNCVNCNNEKARQLEALYNSINTSYTNLKIDIDSINTFMDEFKNNETYQSRIIDQQPISNLIDLDSSFTTKVDTSVFYEPGDYIKFIEVRENIKPMTFYTPTEFIKGYIQNDTIVLEQSMKQFYMFSSEIDIFDISFINSLYPSEDTPTEIEQYKKYEFELVIYTPGEYEAKIFPFSYYESLSKVQLSPGCKFILKYKGNGTGNNNPFMFPKYKKLKLVEIRETNVLSALI